jgi:hypothetical protein
MSLSNNNNLSQSDQLGAFSPDNDYEMNSTLDNDERDNSSEVIQISLLEEKLKVTRNKQKVGEIVVRKQVETKLIQIPIRREKLIIERVGKNPEHLSEVITNQEKVNGFEYNELENTNRLHVVKSAYLNVTTAQELLDAIAHLASANNAKVSIEIMTNDANIQQQHQDICDRFN